MQGKSSWEEPPSEYWYVLAGYTKMIKQMSKLEHDEF